MEFADGIYYLIDPANPNFTAENALEFQPGKWDAKFKIEESDNIIDKYFTTLKLNLRGTSEQENFAHLFSDRWNESYSIILIHEEDIHLWPNRRVYDIEDTLKNIRGNKHDILLLETDFEFNFDINGQFEDRPTHLSVFFGDYENYINHEYVNIEKDDSGPIKLIYQLLRDKDVSYAVSPMIIAISNVLIKNKKSLPEIPGLEKYPLYTQKAVQALQQMKNAEESDPTIGYFYPAIWNAIKKTYKAINRRRRKQDRNPHLYYKAMVHHANSTTTEIIPEIKYNENEEEDIEDY